MPLPANVGGDKHLQLVSAQGRLSTNAGEFGCGNKSFQFLDHRVALAGRWGYYLGRAFHTRPTDERSQGSRATARQTKR
jgi:hypothetical protein